MVDHLLLAPCGLYCGICSAYIAHRDGDLELKSRLAEIYHCSPESVACRGCRSEETAVVCRGCPIRACALDRRFNGCQECPDFPCAVIREGNLPLKRDVILTALREWATIGTEQWAAKWRREEGCRVLCPHCGYALLKGVRHCWGCDHDVGLDRPSDVVQDLWDQY